MAGIAIAKEKSAEAGFDLKARLPIYPEFIAQDEKFLPASLLSYVERLAMPLAWSKTADR